MNPHEQSHVTEGDIQAYVDGQLEPGTRRADAVEAHLAANPEARARVRAYAKQDEAIRARYANILAQPVPERLTPEAMRAAKSKPAATRHSTAVRFAAGLTGLGCAALIGWLVGQSADTSLERFADRTLAYLAEDGEATSGGDAATFQSVSALGGTPDFAAEGLELVSTRRVDNGDMYEARYKAATGEELRLFVVPDPQRHNDLLHRTREDGGKVVYWRQGPLMYALTGDFSERDLDELADTAIERYKDKLAGSRFAQTDRDASSPVIRDESVSALLGSGSVESQLETLPAGQLRVEEDVANPADDAAPLPELNQDRETRPQAIQ